MFSKPIKSAAGKFGKWFREITDNLNTTDVADEVIQVSKDVWNQVPVIRGKDIDDLFGNNLGRNFPTVDVLQNRTVTSVKSYDLSANRNVGSNFFNTLKSDIDKLNKFKERSWGGVTITLDDYDSKVLNIILPDAKLSKEQYFAFKNARDHASSLNIGLNVSIVKVK